MFSDDPIQPLVEWGQQHNGMLAHTASFALSGVGSFACAVAGTLLVLVPPNAIKIIVDDVIRGHQPERLLPWVLMAAAAWFGRDLLNALRIVLNNTLEQNVIFDIRSDLYRRLQSLPLRKLNTNIKPINAPERCAIL